MMGLHMLTMGPTRPSEHFHQAREEAPPDMGWLGTHVLARDLNEHSDANGTGDGDYIWHCFHRSVHMDLESPDLIPRQGYILGVYGHFILLSLPQDLSRSCQSLWFHCGTNFLCG